LWKSGRSLWKTLVSDTSIVTGVMGVVAQIGGQEAVVLLGWWDLRIKAVVRLCVFCHCIRLVGDHFVFSDLS